jgi:effector-binding domain-containing protein
MEPMHYLKLVQRRDSVPRKVVTDYLLSGYLIDKDIDTFAREVKKHYALNDSLPKHYREAFVLYDHLRSKPVAVYRNTVMDEDYDNFRELRNKYPQKMEQKGKMAEQYFGTYWFYYWYE